RAFSRGVALPLSSVLPWMLVAALLASVFDLGKRIAPVPGLANVVRTASRWSASLPPWARASVIGGVTPLLPCGLLYGVFAAAFTCASFGGGALLLGAFALGGAPALLGTQLAVRVRAATGPCARLRRHPLALQKALPLIAAAVIAFRAIQVARGHACH